jgi:excisionase family DNA binding protein
LTKRTWKLRSLPHAAKVLGECGSLREAARQLGVNVSTLSRAIREGRLPAPARGPRRRANAPEPGAQSFRNWAVATYELSPAELELVALAQHALDLAHDPAQKPGVRLAAMAQYRASLRGLNLPEEEPNGALQNATTG